MVLWQGLSLDNQTIIALQDRIETISAESAPIQNASQESSLETPQQASPQPSQQTAQQPMQMISGLLGQIWPFIPGLYAATTALFFILGIAVAQKNLLVSKLSSTTHGSKPIENSSLKKKQLTAIPSFPYEKLLLSDLYVPWIFWKLFAVIGSLTALGYLMQIPVLFTIGGNLSLIFLMIFLLQGIAVVNAYAKKQKNSEMFLAGFYVIVLLIGWILIFVILIGALEPWLDLRSRFLKSDSSS